MLSLVVGVQCSRSPLVSPLSVSLRLRVSSCLVVRLRRSPSTKKSAGRRSERFILGADMGLD
eukprot:scaffold210069_cov35-Attheya_sp.AAC.1